MSALSSGNEDVTKGPDALPGLFTDATLYDRYLNAHRYESSNNKSEVALKGFADLVAGDLNSSEKAITSRLAKLAVAGDSFADPDVFAGSELTSESDSETEVLSVTNNNKELEESSVPSSSSALEELDLAPNEIVDLLIQEFGPLAAEGEEERLLTGEDGAWVHHVVILGTLHLTTHRLTFHASLLSSRPDLSPNQQVIKAGPVTIHRKGWHKKLKVWMELGHDSLTSYASSSDEDRIRPIHTVLYSNIKRVLPVDPKRSRMVQLVFPNEPSVKGYIEFDTEESAHDWRNELTGALFLYRHCRRDFLVNNGDEDLDGVRISIPLSLIDHIDEGDSPTFRYFFSVYLRQAPPHELDASQTDNETISGRVKFVPLRPSGHWKLLRQYIDTAKHRQPLDTPSFTVFDSGHLSCGNEDSDIVVNTPNNPPHREAAIRAALALGNQSEVWITRVRVRRSIAAAGDFVVTPHFVGFWSKLCAQKYRLPISIIKGVKPEDLQFDFKTLTKRDHAIQLINGAIEKLALDSLSISPHSTASNTTRSFSSDGSFPYAPRSRIRSATSILAPLSRTLSEVLSNGDPNNIPDKILNLPRETLFPRPPLHFMCLTIGSRGDVQPYIALGLGLKKEGHRVTIVTHEEYKGWVQRFGIEHRTAGGDPGALMKLSVEHKMFSPEFFKESLTNFRHWLDELLVDAWEQCQGADVLLESPSAMAGVHIAEALNIPYFRCFTMPWTKTTSFPHAFLSPPVESPTFNSASYVLFDNVMWIATSGQINRWRRDTMKIGDTDMGHLAQSKITFIYNFSTAVVPKPLDWTDTTIVSGYWFLDNPDLDWIPPPSLMEWMANARSDGKSIVYIGFGSITVPNPHKVTELIVAAVLKSGVRAIISKGWSGRMSKNTDQPETEIPPECYQLDKVPHDWLFPQIDAALHHGGAGTTGASLRAGIPTLIKPWFGDQYFWASRVHKLGAGLKVSNLRVHDLADALIKATTSRIMKEKAANVGEKIRAENGVHTAIYALYTYMDRASRDRTSLE